MSGQKNSKLKLLYLKEIFEKYTDEEHILNSAEITALLNDYGIDCERKSIYKDIEILIEFGMDIVKTRTPKNGFFLASRDFETAEIRLLADAVQAAGFITEKKTRMLLQKIEKFISAPQADKLRTQVYIDKRNKCSNEEIYYNIDALDNAIKAGKKIKIEYSTRTMDQRFLLNRKTQEFVLSPYALIWSGDQYYLVANNEKYDNLMHLRVDRMHKVTILNERIRHFSEVSEYTNKFDAADYSSKVFYMFSGNPCVTKLMCSQDIIEQIIDRFGENVTLRKAKTGWFYLFKELAINDGLVSWIMQYGEKIKVIAPDELRDMVVERAERIAEIYSEQ